MLWILFSAGWLQDEDRSENRKALDVIQWMVGGYEGGKAGYEKTFTIESEQDGTILTWRSKTVSNGTVLFEDLLVFSYDAPRKRLRARQFAFGTVATYDVEAREGKLVLTETEREGGKMKPWRYTIASTEEGFQYQVDIKDNGTYRAYIRHSVRRS